MGLMFNYIKAELADDDAHSLSLARLEAVEEGTKRVVSRGLLGGDLPGHTRLAAPSCVSCSWSTAKLAHNAPQALALLTMACHSKPPFIPARAGQFKEFDLCRKQFTFGLLDLLLLALVAN